MRTSVLGDTYARIIEFMLEYIYVYQMTGSNFLERPKEQ